MVAVFREVWRVLRPDGTLWLNMGDSYNRSGGAGGDYNKGGLKEGQPRYPGRDVGSLKPKDLCGIPWRLAFALQADGWWLRQHYPWVKVNPMPESAEDRPNSAVEFMFLLTKSARYYFDMEGAKECLAITRNWRNGDGMLLLDCPTKSFSGAHFATYPPALVEPCIKAGTSERGVCPECGSPWERVTEKPKPPKDVYTRNRNPDESISRMARGEGGAKIGHGQKVQNWLNENPTTTLGWQPTCECWKAMPDPDAPRTRNARKRYQQNAGDYWKFRAVCRFGITKRAIVFDPFVGSGTTLQVARDLDRHGIGIDLSMKYLQLARKRLSLDKLAAWSEGVGKNDNGPDGTHKNKNVPGRQIHSFHAARKEKGVTDLPMFMCTPMEEKHE